jgi:hypothetical protein
MDRRQTTNLSSSVPAFVRLLKIQARKPLSPVLVTVHLGGFGYCDDVAANGKRSEEKKILEKVLKRVRKSPVLNRAFLFFEEYFELAKVNGIGLT